MSLPDRVTALTHARAAADDTGCLIVAEKVRPIDARWAEIANDLSHDYKAEQGVTDTAIRAKARALRGILIPHSEATLRSILHAAGWGAVQTLFCWHSWLVLGAFATPTTEGAAGE
jgi:tRNA (cmo5U34)-methyltransferase